MTDVLVCIKRVPDTGGAIALTADGQSVDDSVLGHTVSPHEECAVELAIQIAGATGGTATVLTVGGEDSVEQLRNALAVGCTAAVHIEADTASWGPADVSSAIAAVVQGSSYDLVLLGNDAADTGDFQVGVRLAYALDRPVVTGVTSVSVADGVVTATGDGPEGTDVYEVPLPAVVAVMEGGVEPRYPSIPGRMKAKRVAIENVRPDVTPAGNGRVRLKLPPTPPSQVQILADAVAVVDLFEELKVLR